MKRTLLSWRPLALAAMLVLCFGCRSDKRASSSEEGKSPAADDKLAETCSRRTGHHPDQVEARRKACRTLCDKGLRRHCEHLAEVCMSAVPGGKLCPRESLWAVERACALGSGIYCTYAADAYRQGSYGTKIDNEKANALMKRACLLDSRLCQKKLGDAQVKAALLAMSKIEIPRGTFRPGHRPYDSPNKPRGFRLPEVTLGPFDIDATEVTMGAFAACVKEGRCAQPSGGDGCNWGRPDRLNHPMNCVSHGEAAAFCSWRGRRLPSQDEWELAARGTDDRPYPWGKDPPGDQLCWKRKGTCAVGSFARGKSPYGVLDMEGNVEEWTTSQAYVTNVATFYMAKVSRGASYLDSSTYRMGLNNQHYHRPSESLPWVGFRCVSRAPAGPKAPAKNVVPASR